MAEVKTEVLKDHGDGEVKIRVTAEFTYYRPIHSINDIKVAFEKEMYKYAI